VQAAACAWLGHWYNEVAEDYERAANCYEHALELAPNDAIVGKP
jgi:tetratricopeptide (TPR) repeat protein